MDALWLAAPLPAVQATRGAPDGAWALQPNPAALAWLKAGGVTVEALEALARELATTALANAARVAAPAAGSAPPAGPPLVRQLGLVTLQCTPVVLAPDRLLIWLRPDDNEPLRAQLGSESRAAQFLARALTLAGTSAWRIDLATQRIHFSTVGLQVSGLQPDPAGFPLDAIRSTIHPEDVDAVARGVQEALAGDRVVDVVARYRNPDGSWRTLLTRRVAERDERGRATGVAGVSIDLTALFAERERSQELADRARLVADALRVGFWTRDIETGEESWDDALYSIHGRPRELGPPRGGQWVTACVHPEDQARMAEQSRLEDERFDPASQSVFRIHDRGGQPRWVQSWACRVVRNGRRMVCGMTMDVTERRAAEAALAQRRQLEQANREKSEFMARMSHELRTPMNAVVGFTSLLESDADNPPTPRQRERLQRIGSAARQLMTLIDGLLDVAHRELEPAVAEPAAGLHVLCVEDNPVNLQLVRELIALRPQVRLRTAVDGLSGVKAALAERPDLLLLDLQLPDIDGMEVMRRVRAEKSMEGCRIVALSADAMPDHIEAAMAAGFDDYWTKPIQFDRFLAQIDRLAAER
jgi:CheY-like chemotaxis protein